MLQSKAYYAEQVWFGYYEYEYEQCDYHNYCGEIEAALRKLLSRFLEAFRSSELRKAFFIYGPAKK